MQIVDLHLARFTTQVGSVDKRWFIGLSSPAAAGLMMSYVWALADLGADGHRWAPVSVPVTVVAALLMVSRIRYWSFKGGGNDDAHLDRVPFLTLVMMVGVFVLIAIEGLTAREAGDLLGATPDAVKQRALAARRALLAALAAADRPWRKP